LSFASLHFKPFQINSKLQPHASLFFNPATLLPSYPATLYPLFRDAARPGVTFQLLGRIPPANFFLPLQKTYYSLSMKNLFSVLALCLSLTFIGCIEEEPKDVTAPEVTMTLPTASFHKGNVVIQASATDDKAIAVMEIYVDGTQVHSENANEIEYSLDTKSFADGARAIKVVARDKGGNEGSAEQSIAVMNYVVTLKLALNNHDPLTVHYFYLVDDANTVVDEPKLVSSTTTEIKFNTPDNHTAEKKYSLVYFKRTDSAFGAQPTNDLYVVPGYTQGTYNETVGYPRSTAVMGHYTVNFQNFPSPLLVGYHTEIAGVFPEQRTTPLIIGYDKAAPTAFVAARPDASAPPVYKNFSGLTDAGSTTVTPADFTPMNGVTVPSDPSVTYTFSFVHGHKGTSDLNAFRPVWIHNPPVVQPVKNEFQMYYPGNQFPLYNSGMIESQSAYGDTYVSLLSTPPTAMKRLTARVTSATKTNNVFSITTTGTFDVLLLSGQTNVQGGASTRWHLEVPAQSSITYTLPPVPAQLVSMYNVSTGAWTNNLGAQLHEFSGVAGYDAYHEQTYKNAPAAYENNAWMRHSPEYLIHYQSFPLPNGRVRSTPFDAETYFSRDGLMRGLLRR
jgi:hypothetical protein